MSNYTYNYITLPIETNPNILLQQVYDYLAARIPGWTPAEGNLDVWLAEAMSTETAELTDVASRVPDAIFRYFGATLMGIAPIDSSSATTTTTWTLRDTVGYTIPAGTQVGILDASGVLQPFETINAVTVAPGSSVTAAGAIQIVASNPGAAGSGLGGVGQPVQLIDILDFVNSVTMVQATSGGVDAEDDATYMNRLVGQLQLLALTPILPQDFAKLAMNVTPVYRAVAIDGYNPFHNLLTANEASMETDASGWISAGNVTIASSSAQALDGTKSVSMTAIAAANMAASTAAATQKPTTPGETITGLISIRANTTARICYATLMWYDASSTYINTSGGASTNDSNAAWNTYTITAQAPAGAAFVRLGAFVVSPALGEVHYIDRGSIRRGTTTDWVAGGTAETGQTRTISVACVDVNGNPLAAPDKANVDAYLQSLREVNFLVYIIDATYTSVDVTTQVHILPGYTAANVIAAVQQSVTAYLSPATWGQPPTTGEAGSNPQAWANTPYVRKYELSQVINNVTGVDYINTLTLGIHGGTLAEADLKLGGSVPMATAGTITVTTI